MKHLKHPKHLKHLKHFLWMPGLLFCKHSKELVGKVKDGVDGRQYQKGMLLFSGWIDAIDAIEAIEDIEAIDGIALRGGVDGIEKGHPRWWRVTFFGGDSSWGSYVGGRLFDEFGGGGAGGGAGGHYVDACREVADVE